MKPAQRKWILGLGLAATVALVWLAPEDEASKARPASRTMLELATGGDAAKVRSTPAKTPLSSTLAMQDAQLEQVPRAETGAVADLFRSRTWFVPPPPPPPEPAKGPPPPPSEPTAPPLPFAFMGQVVEDQQVQVVLVRGDRLVTVRAGEKIDQNYRLESIQNGILTFVYLPLDIKQTLAIGGAP